MTDPLAPLARMLRMTSGQVWTLLLGLLLGAVLLATTLPAVWAQPSAPRPVPSPEVP